METIGEHLKRVRKTCGYSLEDVARVTKINLRYLDAIENDDFSRLPGETFLQGFIRSYARFLCIDEQGLINNLKEKKRMETSQSDIHAIEEAKEKRLSITQGNIKIILPLGAGIIALFILLLVFAGGREKPSIESSKEIKEKGDGSIYKKIEPSPFSEVEQDQVLQPARAPVYLKIYAIELTWIRVNIDEKVIKDVLLKPGEDVSWEGGEKITMILGNAGGVEMEINGKRYGPLGKGGEVIRNIVITSEGVNSPSP